MPLPLVAQLFEIGPGQIPYLWTFLKLIPCLGAIALLKIYFGGARNTAERNMHSKVVMITVCRFSILSLLALLEIESASDTL